MTVHSYQLGSTHPHGDVDARVDEVVVVRFRRGAGVVGDPVRVVTAYFDKEGVFLAERDPAPATIPPALPPADPALMGKR